MNVPMPATSSFMPRTLRPPMSTASSGLIPWLVASCAVAIAPQPANVAWQSQIIPPSPITIVNDRNTTENARPPASSVSQYPPNSTGSSATTAMAATGPSMYHDQPDRVATTDLVADTAASSPPPIGRIPRSSAPPVDAASLIRPLMRL